MGLLRFLKFFATGVACKPIIFFIKKAQPHTMPHLRMNSLSEKRQVLYASMWIWSSHFRVRQFADQS